MHIWNCFYTMILVSWGYILWWIKYFHTFNCSKCLWKAGLSLRWPTSSLNRKKKNQLTIYECNWVSIWSMLETPCITSVWSNLKVELCYITAVTMLLGSVHYRMVRESLGTIVTSDQWAKSYSLISQLSVAFSMAVFSCGWSQEWG